MARFVFILSCLFSLMAFASGKKTVEEAKLDIRSQMMIANENCKNQISALNNQSTCEALRMVLDGCGLVAIDESGLETDVADFVQCCE